MPFHHSYTREKVSTLLILRDNTYFEIRGIDPYKRILDNLVNYM